MSLEAAPLTRFARRLAEQSLLGQPELDALLALSGPVIHAVGNRDFIKAGEPTDHAAFVVAGLVGSFGQNRNGHRQITALHLSGDMANLHSVVVPQSSEALQALSVSTIVCVPHATLRDLADTYPKVAAAFWRESAVRHATSTRWMVNLGRRNALARLSHLVCEVACREHGSEGKDGLRFPFLATQTHLADMLGLTPVHVNRTLKALRDDGVIELDNRVVTICDWGRLAHHGEFDSTYLHLSGGGNGQDQIRH